MPNTVNSLKIYMYLTPQDAEMFFSALTNPPAPNDALKKAFKDYQKDYQKDYKKDYQKDYQKDYKKDYQKRSRKIKK